MLRTVFSCGFEIWHGVIQARIQDGRLGGDKPQWENWRYSRFLGTEARVQGQRREEALTLSEGSNGDRAIMNTGQAQTEPVLGPHHCAGREGIPFLFFHHPPHPGALENSCE